ncbi:transglycosylase SLT domain-containing protein [Streptomyces griseofuscus]|uniref:transglycosylase SLT domain-containing protein n=1 Tax=Streptomyces griseofuscus TaxID=146922 RepID=UPI003F518808
MPSTSAPANHWCRCREATGRTERISVGTNRPVPPAARGTPPHRHRESRGRHDLVPQRKSSRMTMATTRTRIARLAVTGLAATGAAAAALTLVPTNAQAAEMPQVHASVVKASHTTATKAGSGNNLDGWIKQSLAIMKAKGIPGSYDGLKRNIMRESGGNPNAQNNWDINAKNGVPSKGLLQVISPTFSAYHVSGTAKNITDPVANITAAANYAAHRYGSIDNVNSAY